MCFGAGRLRVNETHSTAYVTQFLLSSEVFCIIESHWLSATAERIARKGRVVAGSQAESLTYAIPIAGPTVRRDFDSRFVRIASRFVRIRRRNSAMVRSKALASASGALTRVFIAYDFEIRGTLPTNLEGVSHDQPEW